MFLVVRCFVVSSVLHREKKQTGSFSVIMIWRHGNRGNLPLNLAVGSWAWSCGCISAHLHQRDSPLPLRTSRDDVCTPSKRDLKAVRQQTSAEGQDACFSSRPPPRRLKGHKKSFCRGDRALRPPPVCLISTPAANATTTWATVTKQSC